MKYSIILTSLLLMAGSAIQAQNIGRIEGHVGWTCKDIDWFRNGVEYNVFYVYDNFRHIDLMGGIQVTNYYEIERASTNDHTSCTDHYTSYFIGKCNRTAVMIGLRGKYAIGSKLQLSATALAGYGLDFTEESFPNFRNTVYRYGFPIIPTKVLVGITYALSNRTSASLYYGPSYELVFSDIQQHLCLSLSFAL